MYQTDCEEKSNTLETLKSQNCTLARELEQIDVSLLNALEDNGLSIGHMEDLEDAATSGRGIYRRCVLKGTSGIRSRNGIRNRVEWNGMGANCLHSIWIIY